MKDQSYMGFCYHGSVYYCWLWQQEWKKDSAVKFSRVPKIVKNEGEMMEELTTRRRRAWISAISRPGLTGDKFEHERDCYRYFVSGQAAKQWDQFLSRSVRPGETTARRV